MSKTVYFAVSCDGKGQQALKTIQDALNGVSCVTRVFLEENTAPALLTRFEKLSKQERDKVAAYMSQRIVAQARRDQMIARAQGQQAVRRPQRLQATGKPTAKPRGTGTVPRASGPAVTQPPRPDHRAEKMAEAKKAIKIANKALVALKEDQANKQYLRDGRFESGDPELPEHIRSVFAQHRAALEARKALQEESKHDCGAQLPSAPGKSAPTQGTGSDRAGARSDAATRERDRVETRSSSLQRKAAESQQGSAGTS